MSSLELFEFDGDQIREQNDLWSVFDIIKVIGNRKNPRQVWKGLTDNYPDTVQKCDSVKFTRKDGKRANIESPACSREVALEIIQLLPGQVGAKFRTEVAKRYIQYLDADPGLIDDLIMRVSDPEQLKWHKVRIEGKLDREGFTDEIKKRVKPEILGHTIAVSTDCQYNELFDHTAKELKAIRKTKNLRDSMSRVELAAISFAEVLATEKMKDDNAKGFTEVVDCSKTTARKIRKAME